MLYFNVKNNPPQIKRDHLNAEAKFVAAFKTDGADSQRQTEVVCFCLTDFSFFNLISKLIFPQEATKTELN